ncbi:ATP-grasp domain-containing protein [Vagococcus silagei]
MRKLSKVILPNQTIGIIGGNHLARFMCFSAKKMGCRVIALDPDINSAASSIVDEQIVGNYNDGFGLLELIQKSDIITYESELADAQTLDYLKAKTKIPQGVFGLEVTQDRRLEREFLNHHLINISPYTVAYLISEVREAGRSLGYPLVVKNIHRDVLIDSHYVICSEAEVDKAVPFVQQGGCLIEPFLKIQRELFITIAVNKKGDYTLFPIVETKHGKNGELKEVYASYDDLSEDLENQIVLIGKVIASELNTSGVIGVELFLMENGNLYVNEISTRPHEAGLFTMDSCNFSVFDTHIKGICNLPMPEICQFIPSISIMISEENVSLITSLMTKKRNWHYYFYKPQNLISAHTQIGHVTILSDNFAETKQELKYLGLIK